MAPTEEEWIAIRNSYFNPNGFWRSGGYDAGAKKWFLTDAKTSTYRNYTEAQVKEEFLNYKMRDLQEQFTTAEQMPAWGITEPRTPTEPTYPMKISRDPLSFTAFNPEEETQLKEFLGIDPAGIPLDEHVSKLDAAGLDEWETYWVNIWTNLKKPELTIFTTTEANAYRAKLPAPPTEIPWWKQMLTSIDITKLLPFKIALDPLKLVYEKVTGTELTEKEWLRAKGELLDWILPIDIFSKLLTGKNLKGEAEEFGSAGDWLEILFNVGLLAIPGPLDDVAARVATKTISKTEAARLSLQLGEKEVVARLIARVKANPTSSARLLSKFPVAVRDGVIVGLGKTSFGREVIFSLGKTGFYRFTRPIWSKAMINLFKVSAVGIALMMPIFAFTEIPNWLNMRQFARKQILEEEGNWPSSIAFKLNNLENLMQSYAYDIDRDIKALRSEEASEKIGKLKENLEIFKTYIEEKKEVMLPEDYIWGTELIEFYNIFMIDREKRIIEVPTETDEEKWERIRKETEERREAELLEEEERWKRIQEEAARRKAAARIEEAEYWAKLQAAAEARAAERKIEEAEYWKRIQEEAETARIEKREEAEEYWKRVQAEEEARKEAEALEWERRLIGPKKATITIISEPTNAQVYIDGEFQWTTTPYTTLLTEGDHIIRVQKDGYFPIEIIAEIEEDEVTEIPFILEKIPEPDIPIEPYIPQKSYLPDYKPIEPYIPSIITTPRTEVPAFDYPKLYPEVMTTPDLEPMSPPMEKELLINIETTDLMPTKGRIYSIAFLDLTTPGAEIQIATLDDEATLINGFLDFFEANNFIKLVGYNVSFDYRYIFTKMMKYRRVSKLWKNIELRDVMQIMKQVKEEFVFGFNKPGTLDAWGKMILGRGKYGSQELMLRKYISGDFDYVRAFQTRQIELTRDLYTLARFVSSEAFISAPAPVSEPITPLESHETTENPKPTGIKQCPSCFANNPLSAKECEICKAAI